MKIDIKPLSVNQVWQGKRFKTKLYTLYEKEMMFKLPKLTLPNKPYQINIEFGISNKKSDIDNPVKPFLDLLQKRYLFNDCDIYALNVRKIDVKKGLEFINFEILEYIYK